MMWCFNELVDAKWWWKVRAAVEVEVVKREQSNRRKRKEPRLVWI